MGGYEPDITFQGPLEAEYIMEEVLAAVKGPLTTDVDEPHDPQRDAFQGYFWQALETPKPDVTPEAGTRLEVETTPEYLWVPDDFEVDLTPASTVPPVGQKFPAVAEHDGQMWLPPFQYVSPVELHVPAGHSGELLAMSKAAAQVKIPDMVSTELVSHAPRSWLKALARLNIPYMFVTELVSHAPMSWLKTVAL